MDAAPLPLPEVERQAVALRAQRADAQLALAWFEGPAYARIEEQYQQILQRYEVLLHSLEIDAALRDRACMGVQVAKEFLGVKRRYAQQLASADARLTQLEHDAPPTGPAWDRIMRFVR